MNRRVVLPKFRLQFYLILVLASCSNPRGEQIEDYTGYVDQYIGTGGHGHVFMGANVPFGFVQLGPTSIPQTWDWTSGYHITDTTVIGFSHLHLSGTGIGDLSDISLMPAHGEVVLNRGNEDDPASGMWSYFSRKNERVQPGYYSTYLDRYGIAVELTATKRVGFHKYTFPSLKDAFILIDLENGTCWDSPVEGYITLENDSVVSGYRYSTGWANNQKVYFTAVFSKPVKKFVVSEANNRKDQTQLKSQRVYGLAYFDVEDQEAVYVKVALSPVSIENAKLNLEAELPHWDFKKTVANARELWNSELGKIHIETRDASVKRIFYTGLYHTMIAPSVFCDVNGDYRGADGQIYRNAGFVNYTTFSLWDTYRAAHPLMTLIHPEKVGDMINSMLHIYKQQGKVPVWHLMGCETDCMIGNPGIPVIADAILKGFEGFDSELAYTAMKNSAMLDERGLAVRRHYGYIPYDLEPEGLSKCMEYAIADWSLAMVANKEGKEEDFRYFMERSKSYRHYFDSSTGFVRGLSSEGRFRPEFNPVESVHRDNDYAEGNAWQYTWLVPHDVNGLVDLFGSKNRVIEKLDSLFIVEGDLGEHASPDISGLIGQYAHGNEPGHHVAYLYTLLSQPWKTADKVRTIMSELYTDKFDGICGNEDVGQMSAWYILSAMGIYQVEPAGGKFVFGSPVIDKAVIRPVEGNRFTIKAINNSAQNKYIQSVKLNGKKYTRNFLQYEDIRAGGTLEFFMGKKPVLYYDVD